MANYASLKAAIQQVVKTNGNNEITGALLQQSLLAMIDSLGNGYEFVGIASPSTNPGTPDQNVYYFASTAGNYVNFNGIILNSGEIAILKYNGSWSKDLIGAASLESVQELEQTTVKNSDIISEYVLISSFIERTKAYLIDGTEISSALRTYYYDVTPGQKIKIECGLFSSGGFSVVQAFNNNTFVESIINSPISEPVTKYYTVPENVNIIGCTYFNNNIFLGKNRITILENDVELNASNIQNNTESFNKIVGKYYKSRTIVPWGNVERYKYWNVVNNVAGLQNAGRYFARENLFDVLPGDSIEFTAKNANIDMASAAISYYDAESRPALAGNTARVNFSQAQSIIDNGDGTTTFTFVLPPNVYKLGLYYRIEPVTVIVLRNDVVEYSQTLDEHIEEIAKNETVEKMLGIYTKESINTLDWGVIVYGKYWNLVDGIAGLVNASGYGARSTLLPVTPGQELKIKVSNSDIYLPGAAFSGYDNDGRGAYSNGTVARVNFNQAQSQIDNGDGTTTFTFILGENVTQIGIYYRDNLVTYTLKTNESVDYSATLDAHIEEVAGGGSTTNADSAKYYLKGESPKSFSKRICIISAGQSNIDGRVPYANMPSEIQAAQPIANCNYVKNSENGAFAPLNITGLWGFDLVTYYNLSLSRQIYVIKWSLGGTSIDPQGDSQYHWTADYEKLTSETYSLLLKFESEIRNHVASDGEQFDIRAMLWHQGEGDRGSLGTGSADRYYINLRNMISYIRGIVGNERLPIITGTISHYSAQFDAKIEAAQQQLAQEDPYFRLIDMSGAPLLDSFHFNAAASVYFGEMAYDALIDFGVITGTKLNPTRPW